jgi:hypothetical protein
MENDRVPRPTRMASHWPVLLKLLSVWGIFGLWLRAGLDDAHHADGKQSCRKQGQHNGHPFIGTSHVITPFRFRHLEKIVAKLHIFSLLKGIKKAKLARMTFFFRNFVAKLC